MQLTVVTSIEDPKGTIENFDLSAWCLASQQRPADCTADFPSYDILTCSAYCKYNTPVDRLK